MTTGYSVSIWRLLVPLFSLEVADSSVPVWCDYWFLCSVWRLLVLLFPLFSLEVAGSSVQSEGCWFLCSLVPLFSLKVAGSSVHWFLCSLVPLFSLEVAGYSVSVW